MYVVKRDPAKGYIDTHLWVPKSYINVDGTKRSLTHVFIDRYGGGTKTVELFREAPNHLLVPRAFWDVAQLPFEVIDCRPPSYNQVEFKSRVRLDYRMKADTDGQHKLLPTGLNVQHRSMDAMMNSQGGVLQLGCGHGKTVVAIHHIAERQVPALVLVDNTQLLHQWSKEIEQLLDVPGGIGIIADGKKEWQKGLVMATYISVANWADEMPEEVRRWFGGIYWDEGHHLSAPVFSKTAELFYGDRYCLSATPERADGYHIIADMHVGKVLHKDLSQPLKATFLFYWTGMELDLTDPQCDVLAKNKEVHISKVFKYFGRWRPRLWRISQDCADAVQAGRHVLVVGSSIDEVVNLMTIWTRGPNSPLITDLPYPTPQEVGETLLPLELEDKDGKRLEQSLEEYTKKLAQGRAKNLDPKRLNTIEERLASAQTDWERYKVYKKLERENDRRRSKFIADLAAEPSSAGFMTYEVSPELRQHFVRTRHVIFAIMKYGKEGLDAPHLDTVIVSTPFSQKGGLQQLMGRITGRPMPGKKRCVVAFYRDNIGEMHNMCDKLERHLRTWPVDEGGPFDSSHINNPRRVRWQKYKSLKEAFEDTKA